jgi:hypothetical protein
MESAGVNDQFFLGKELERAVSLHVDGVSNLALNCWKHGDDRADFMVAGCIIDFLANCKLRHRKLLLESSMRVYHQNWLMFLNDREGTREVSGRRQAAVGLVHLRRNSGITITATVRTGRCLLL